MKKVIFLLLSAGLFLTSCKRCKTTQECSIRPNGTFYLKGYGKDELGYMVVKRYQPNSKFDMLVDSEWLRNDIFIEDYFQEGDSTLSLDLWRGFSSNSPSNRGYDFTIHFTDVSRTDTFTEIIATGDATREIKHDCADRPMGCIREIVSFELDGVRYEADWNNPKEYWLYR